MRTELQKMRDIVQARKYQDGLQIDDCFEELTARYIDGNNSTCSEIRRETQFFQEICNRQQPIVKPGERIVFTRTIGKIAASRLNNICADWELILREGIDGRIATAMISMERFRNDPCKVEFLQCSTDCLKAVAKLIERHADIAIAQGNEQLEELLRRVAHERPRTFHEALQLHNFIRESLWLAGYNHIGFGRFDQYMMPFLQADIDSGCLTLEKAEDLLVEFFIAANRNTQFYHGIQQGDNGQSMVLGGVTSTGTCGVNELTYMCMRVSESLNLIDPKINLRVDSNTDIKLLEVAARLTRRGLGFPQYSNDDVVIPALTAHGYDIEDARNYSVAACWEFVIPGKGLEIPNIDALSFAHAVDIAIRNVLAAGGNFDDILAYVKMNIRMQVDAYVNHWKNFRYRKSPLYSAILTDCLENGLEAEDAARYKNFGIHGSASANAADALTAVKKFVFETKTVKPEELLKAIESNWQGAEPLRQMIIDDDAKVGNNDATANAMLRFVFDAFADACEAWKDNFHGRIVRPGTGSAMYYVWLTDKSLHPFAVDATADGRHKGDFFSSSLAPSPGVRVNGPISILQSYANIDYSRIYNGGPITMELSDTVFRTDDDLKKVAMLIKTFIMLGCQQLQLNTLNVATLKDAVIHPELHRNLVVRVWGWSGYFCELEKPYQQHIIQRNMLTINS